jgi:hypothetical protein
VRYCWSGGRCCTSSRLCVVMEYECEMLWSMSVRECGMVLSVGESEMNHVKGNENNKIDNNRNDNVNNNTINNTTKKIIKKRIDKIKLFFYFFYFIK